MVKRKREDSLANEDERITSNVDHLDSQRLETRLSAIGGLMGSTYDSMINLVNGFCSKRIKTIPKEIHAHDWVEHKRPFVDIIDPLADISKLPIDDPTRYTSFDASDLPPYLSDNSFGEIMIYQRDAFVSQLQSMANKSCGNLLLAGPPGCGSTVCAYAFAHSKWLAQRKQRIIWFGMGGGFVLQISNGLVDFRRFLMYLRKYGTEEIVFVDGHIDRESDLSDACIWAEPYANRGVIATTSITAYRDINKGQDFDEFFVPSWTLEEYRSAWLNPKFRDSVGKYFGSRLSLAEKYYYAGASVKHMFGRSVEECLNWTSKRVYYFLVNGRTIFSNFILGLKPNQQLHHDEVRSDDMVPIALSKLVIHELAKNLKDPDIMQEASGCHFVKYALLEAWCIIMIHSYGLDCRDSITDVPRPLPKCELSFVSSLSLERYSTPTCIIPQFYEPAYDMVLVSPADHSVILLKVVESAKDDYLLKFKQYGDRFENVVTALKEKNKIEKVQTIALSLYDYSSIFPGKMPVSKSSHSSRFCLKMLVTELKRKSFF